MIEQHVAGAKAEILGVIDAGKVTEGKLQITSSTTKLSPSYNSTIWC